MSINKTGFAYAEARDELLKLIDNFIDLGNTTDLRQRVKLLVAATHVLRQFGKNVIKANSKISARDRILTYLKQYPLTVIDSEELLVVSGITDYQRRIRELRIEFGWPIISGKTAKAMWAEGEWQVYKQDVSEMKPDEYILLDSGQDMGAANRWRRINSLRKQKLSVKDKLIKYFLENVGRQITGEELVYLANSSKEWARRVRELRTEDGWTIRTRNTGRPDLPVGVYVLEDAHQAEIHDRKIDDTERIIVLKRDNFSCCKCGWNNQQKQLEDPRQFLELHHLDYHANKGSNKSSNLITLCNIDHDFVHKMKFTKEQVYKWIENKN
jgi:hypothetical protein